ALILKSMAWRERAILKVKRLKDLLEHADRADRIYYHAKGSYYLILAANMLWEGDLEKEDKVQVERLKTILGYKGVEVADIFDTFEAVDYLKAVIRG
ncbi:MAG: hypothetical protein QXZ31_07205, partial [Thermofilaceae archaeon]